MQFRRILPRRLPVRAASIVGLGLLVFATMLGTDGCLTYKLNGIDLEPNAGACIAQGSTAQFTAYGIYTENNHANKTLDITDSVHWSTDLPELATVSSTGLATSSTTYLGLTNVKASTEGEFKLLWKTVPLTVSNNCLSGSGAVRRLSSMHLIPENETLRSVGDTTELVAVGLYSSEPLSGNLSGAVHWTSSDPGVAKVSPEGLVTAMGAGDATITATRTNELGSMVTATETIHVGGN